MWSFCLFVLISAVVTLLQKLFNCSHNYFTVAFVVVCSVVSVLDYEN